VIATTTPASFAVRATPALFVVIWASGFVVAKYAAPHAEPLSFLLIRYAGVVALMLLLAVAARASWPRGRSVLHIAVAGIGIHAGYLGGVWTAIAAGMPAAHVRRIVDEFDAVDACLRTAERGDLVVLLPTSVQAVWNQMLAFSPTRRQPEERTSPAARLHA